MCVRPRGLHEYVDAGARIRNNGLLKLLSAEHQVDAIAFGGPESAEALGRLTRRASVVPLPPTRSPMRRAIGMATTGLPDMALRLWSPAFEQALRCTLDSAAYSEPKTSLRMLRCVTSIPFGAPVEPDVNIT